MATAAEQLTLKRIDEWQAGAGQLPREASLCRELLKLQIDAAARFAPQAVCLDTSVIAAKAEAGEPLLTFDDVAIDWALLEHLYGKAGNLLEVPADDATDLKALARGWFDGAEPDAGTNRLAAMGASLKPFLAARREALQQAIPQEAWRRGYCPVCGGMPDFAYLDAERGERWLVCSRCDAEWLFQRLECAFCGNRDQNTLAYFADEQAQYRLYVCERCRCYLKAIDLRKSGSKTFLPVERVLTLDMDVQARQNGYCRPAACNRLDPDG